MKFEIFCMTKASCTKLHTSQLKQQSAHPKPCQKKVLISKLAIENLCVFVHVKIVQFVFHVKIMVTISQ